MNLGLNAKITGLSFSIENRMQKNPDKINPNHLGKLVVITAFAIAYIAAINTTHYSVQIKPDYNSVVPFLIMAIMAIPVMFIFPLLMVLAIIFNKYEKYILFKSRVIYPTLSEYNNACVSIMLLNLPLVSFLSKTLIEHFNIRNFVLYFIISIILYIYPYIIFWVSIGIYNDMIEFEIEQDKYNFYAIKLKREKFKLLIKITLGKKKRYKYLKSLVLKFLNWFKRF